MEIKKIYKDDSTALDSFNQLTEKTFGFNFVDWHAAGHFGDMYVPHVMAEGKEVISNVSVNRMQFDIGGKIKNFIQLGTVMTDTEYRGQGLNRKLMEAVIREYADKADGIYLFGNDSVLDYYPKFGFVPCEEYEYYFTYENNESVIPYSMEKVNMADEARAKRVYDIIENYFVRENVPNENDAMYMSENIGLYHFWLDSEYSDSVYYLPECGAYVVGGVENRKLYLYEIIGKRRVKPERVAKAFGEGFSEVVLGYTPVHREGLSVRIHKEEDCTLFVRGNAFDCVSKNRMMFPVLSHA